MRPSKIVLIGIILAGLLLGGLIIYKLSLKPPTIKVSPSAKPNSLDIPILPATPSAEQKSSFLKYVAEQAKEGSTIEINNCLGNPKVLRVKPDQTLEIKNNDKEDHTIIIGVKNTYPIQAGKSVVIKASDIAPAIYLYRCLGAKGQTVVSGIISLLPPAPKTPI